MLSRKRDSAQFIPLIIVINVLVFLLWKFGETYLPPNFMEENFLVSYSALEEGRYWVLLTSVFSHNMVFHLLINMYVLHSFGSFLELFMGRVRVFLFFLVAGLCGSVAHALTSAYMLGKPDLMALGASGGVAGVILLFSLLFPKEKILLMGIIPLPALFGALAFMGLDIWGLYTQTQGGGLPIGHGAHLGGALAGVIYYFYLRSVVRNKMLESVSRRHMYR